MKNLKLKISWQDLLTTSKKKVSKKERFLKPGKNKVKIMCSFHKVSFIYYVSTYKGGGQSVQKVSKKCPKSVLELS